MRIMPVPLEPPATPADRHWAGADAPHGADRFASITALGTRSLCEGDAAKVERIQIGATLERRLDVCLEPEGLYKGQEVRVRHILAFRFALQRYTGCGSSVRRHG